VAEESPTERLEATSRFVVVLGLVVDKVGRVLYGEIVDPGAEGRHHFVGLDGIPVAVRDWLRERASTQGRDDS
jgi:hypothetical protein